jgi:hypothetical protein
MGPFRAIGFYYKFFASVSNRARRREITVFLGKKKVLLPPKAEGVCAVQSFEGADPHQNA